MPPSTLEDEHRSLFRSADIRELFADAINAAHYFAAGRWWISVQARFITLFVAGRSCVSLSPGTTRLLVLQRLIPTNVPLTPRQLVESIDVVEVSLPNAQFTALGNSLGSAVHGAIEWAATNPRSAGTRSNHDQAVVEYLRQQLRRWLPQPDDGLSHSTNEDDVPFSARCFELLSELGADYTLALYEQRKNQLRRFVHTPLRSLARLVVAAMPQAMARALETRCAVFSRFLAPDGTQLATTDHWVSFGPKGRMKDYEPVLFILLLQNELQFGFDARQIPPPRQEHFAVTLSEWFDREPKLVSTRVEDLSLGMTPAVFLTAAEWIKSGGVADQLLVYSSIAAEDLIGTPLGDISEEVTRTFDRIFPLFEIAADIDDIEEIDLLVEPPTQGTAPNEPKAAPVIIKPAQRVSPYSRDDAIKDVLIEATFFDDMLTTLLRKKNIVMEGPPGVGKTYVGIRLARALIGHDGESNVSLVQFHQSYSYEDFVQGLRPVKTGGFELRSGPFMSLAKAAAAAPHQRFALLIDEINRGNLSRILGELLMLIEHDKRSSEHAVTLAYSPADERFYVPHNLYVIGMMNTADRSLAMVDYALRRRFSFFRIAPAFNEKFRELLRLNGASDDFIDQLVTRIKRLNDRIREDRNLGAGFEIGHSYFCPSNGDRCDLNWLRQVVETEIRPMLHEYWFDALADADEAANNLLR